MRTELQTDRVTIYVGDSADLDLPANSVDAIVCDPPSGIAFMGKAWDKDKGGRDGWIAWLARTIAPAFAALKPGGHGLFWALPRTSHWTAMALELAGFDVRDRITHLFGTGFPKSHNLDGGLGTALKPAAEDWWLVRKPLVGTVAATVLAHGTGALNIDASRIGYDASGPPAPVFGGRKGEAVGGLYGASGDYMSNVSPLGRWPAHVVFSHSEGCEVVGQTREDRPILEHTGRSGEVYGAGLEGSRAVGTVPVVADVYRCEPGCAVAELDRQSGHLKSPGNISPTFSGGSDGTTVAPGKRVPSSFHLRPKIDGGASRFFYCAKPSKAETEAGLADLPGKRKNTHPTKKSVALMRYLIRLITPPGGVVLDPFAGSGTTGIAALVEGMRFIGCEQGGDGEEYVPILLGRIGHALQRHG